MEPEVSLNIIQKTLLSNTFSQCFKRQEKTIYIYIFGCMRQVLRPGALGRPRGTGWRGRWEGGSGWGIHVNPWLIYVNVWQKPLQYCKIISLQLIKINGKKWGHLHTWQKNQGMVFKLKKQNKTKKKLKAQMDFFSLNIGEVQNLIRMYLF